MSMPKKCFPPSAVTTGNEKSSFTMTCNRLSSFLKEKGGLRDLRINENFDVKGKPEISSLTTIDLLSSMESTVRTSINHIPQYVSLDSFCNSVGSREPDATQESRTGQMTILYGSQVLVFDCVSADKARDLVLAASSNQIQPGSTRLESQADESDLPIVRRASLHRFLAKRKDRATERGPYQLHNPLLTVAPLKHKFDLNL